MTDAVVVAGIFFFFLIMPTAVAIMPGAAAVSLFTLVMMAAVVGILLTSGHGVIEQLTAEELRYGFIGAAAVAAVDEDPGGLKGFRRPCAEIAADQHIHLIFV